MKTPKEKGHRESMNIIWNIISEEKPTYWIHMEDDLSSLEGRVILLIVLHI